MIFNFFDRVDNIHELLFRSYQFNLIIILSKNHHPKAMNRFITKFIQINNISKPNHLQSLNRSLPICLRIHGSKSLAYFSTEKSGDMQITQEELSNVRLVRGTANHFYRNSLRVLTESNRPSNYNQMNRIVKLSRTKKDGLLLFQAYFNYTGRETVMPNSTVDKFLLKAIKIQRSQLIKDQIQQLIDRQQFDRKIRQKMLQFLNMHDYLHYFPHYNVTEGLIETFLSHPSQTMQIKKMNRILKQKCLIKLNERCFNLLLDGLKNEEIEEQGRRFIFNTVISRALFLWNNPEWSQQSLINICRTAIQNMCQNQSVVILNQINEKCFYLQKIQESLEKSQHKEQVRLILSSLYLLVNKQEKAFDYVDSVSNFESKQGKAFLLCLNALKKSQNETIDQNYLQERISALKQSKKIQLDSQ